MTQMQRQLSAVPVTHRRRAVGALVLLGLLLVVIGILPWTSPAPSEIRASAVAALVAGILAGLIAWGLQRSITLDKRRAAAAELDALLAEAGGGCDCGHDHGGAAHPSAAEAAAGFAPASDGPNGAIDPDCPSDGLGHNCAHTCAACVFSQR